MSTKTNIEVEIEPFRIPTRIAYKFTNESADVTRAYVGLEELSPETLERLCNDFTNTLFEKAGALRPTEPGWQSVITHYIERKEPEFKSGDEVLVYDSTMATGPMNGEVMEVAPMPALNGKAKVEIAGTGGGGPIRWFYLEQLRHKDVKSSKPAPSESKPTVVIEKSPCLDGMTVRELKAIVNRWSEVDPFTGEECEVWVDTGAGLTNQAKGVLPLNYRLFGEEESADLLIWY